MPTSTIAVPTTFTTKIGELMGGLFSGFGIWIVAIFAILIFFWLLDLLIGWAEDRLSENKISDMGEEIKLYGRKLTRKERRKVAAYEEQQRYLEALKK